jgi:hypothetical protein
LRDLLAPPAIETPRLPARYAWLVVLLWAPYVALNTLFPGPLLTYAVGLLIAALALGLLWRGGVAPSQCFVRVGGLSRQGTVLLVALSIFIPAALLLGRGQPLSWQNDLVFAPASALGQELYFRAALFTACARLCRGNTTLALNLQAGGFALWHIRAFQVVAFAPASGVLVVTFVAGVLWGLQVARDRTIFYAALEHAIFLIVQ